MSLLANSNAIESGGYNIDRSLRFRSSASAYLSRTPASAGNRQTWTWSGWIKRGTFGSQQDLFISGSNVSSNLSFQNSFNSSDNIIIYASLSGVSNDVVLQTSAVYRDPSSWYHIIVSVDTTQATASNRVKLYVNGSQVTAFSTATYPSQNYATSTNNTVAHTIGRFTNVSANYFDGYLSEVNFIDGQALTPSSFGQTDAVTGVWTPKKYTGTYGTNGFYLNFSDNSSNTATTIGKDNSGNGNNWTPNNISVTAGVTYDSMLDSPTPYADGGNGRGNYCVLNPLNKGTNQTIASGNLSNTASGHGTVLPTIGVTSGLWYAEVTLTTSGAGGIGFTINPQAESSYGEIAGKWWCYDNGSGFYIISQTTATASLATKFSAGQVWQWAIDTANGKLWIGLNNSWFSSAGATTGNPATGANPTFTFTAGTLIWPILENAGGPVWNANFGQRPFAYTPPTGFKALNTSNLLSTTAITTSGTFTGNGSADGPFVYLNGVPTAMTINGNAVTFATHADKLANGFKVRTTSSSYNNSGVSNSYTISTTGAKFKYANAQGNP